MDSVDALCIHNTVDCLYLDKIGDMDQKINVTIVYKHSVETYALC